MNQEENISLIDDRISQRFESFVQTQNKLHEEFHKKMVDSVTDQIVKTVNGKIDGIKKQLDSQDITLNEIREQKKFITQLWGFLKFLGGVLVSLGGAIILYKNMFK